eukprot:g2566.t1
MAAPGDGNPQAIRPRNTLAAVAIIHTFFGRLGGWVAVRPRATVGLFTLISLLFASGWSQFNLEERPEHLYTPQSSRAFTDKTFVDATFGHGHRRLDVFVTRKSADAAPALTSPTALREVFRLTRALENLTTEYDGDAVGLRDVCLRNRVGSCVVESALAFFDYNETALDAASPSDALSVLNKADCCGVQPLVAPDSVMGSIARGGDGKITRVGAYRVSYVLHNDVSQKHAGAEAQAWRAMAVEEEAWRIVKRFNQQGADVQADCFSMWAFDDASGSSIQRDTSLVFLAYVLLTVFASFVMWSEFSACVLGPVCVITVMLSVAASFGLVMAAGESFSLVVNSVIFVLLGLGVDDAFVIMASLRRQPADMPAPERVSRALSVAGGSIMLTSVTDLVAFLIGSTTVIPALHSFCVFAGVAVLFDFGLQVTIFVAAVVLLSGRNCCCAPRKQRVFVEADTKGATPGREQPPPPQQQQQQQPAVSRGQQLMGQRLPRLLLTRSGKAAVLVATTAALAVCCVSAAKLEMRFHYDWFVPDDTEAKASMRVRDEHFGGMYLPVYLFTKRADYSRERDTFKSLTEAFQNETSVLPNSVDSWYDAFVRHAGPGGVPAQSAAFYSALHAFLHTPAGVRYAANVKFDASNSTVIATRVPALFKAMSGIKEELVAMARTRAVIDGVAAIDGTVYTYPMLFWEGLAVVEAEIIRNVLIAAACVFVVCWLMLASLSGAAIVLCVIAMIDVCLLGSMHIAGDSINMVTAINLLLAIGLCIDYSAHVCHAFLVARGTRDERAAAALEHMGLPVLYGGMSTGFAIISCTGARSYIFQSFGRMFLLIVFWGLYFGLIVLPVLLSLFGPASAAPSPVVQDEEVSSVALARPSAGAPAALDQSNGARV